MDYIGFRCPVCDKNFHADDDVVVCPVCGTPITENVTKNLVIVTMKISIVRAMTLRKKKMKVMFQKDL